MSVYDPQDDEVHLLRFTTEEEAQQFEGLSNLNHPSFMNNSTFITTVPDITSVADALRDWGVDIPVRFHNELLQPSAPAVAAEEAVAAAAAAAVAAVAHDAFDVTVAEEIELMNSPFAQSNPTGLTHCEMCGRNDDLFAMDEPEKCRMCAGVHPGF